MLELTYTAWDMQPFAKDLGYEGEPFRWDPERRAQLRAELDAYYAYLYGLSKKELRYILDPKDVMGEDYPSETFRVLKEQGDKEHGSSEWRTQRLVLEAYDRFARDGTFDPARLEDPEYFPVVRDALAVSKSREQELERTLEELVARSDRERAADPVRRGRDRQADRRGRLAGALPGRADAVLGLAAGGTTQMRSLATPARRCASCSATGWSWRSPTTTARAAGSGRDEEPAQGRRSGAPTNGMHWCLLKPTRGVPAGHGALQDPGGYWPFTIENALPRRPAPPGPAEEGSLRGSRGVQADLTRDAEVAKRIVGISGSSTRTDDAYFYLMAPSPQAKDAFAAWVTDPARLTPPTSPHSRSC